MLPVAVRVRGQEPVDPCLSVGNGPAVGGFMLQHAPNALWPIAAALNVVAALSALALERHLPRAVARAPSRIEPVEVGL